MTLFNLILKKVLNIDKYIFSILDENNKINTYQQLIFNSMLSLLRYNGNKLKYKFIFLNNFLNNSFYTNEVKNQFIEHFYKIQKTYNAFNRFAYIYKCNSSKIVVNKDMALNEINLNDKNIICIYQLNYRYLFNINDILKVIQNSLTNSDMFFITPLTIKNPYNNMPFNKSTLYNIYFFIKFNTDIYCDLFFKYFNENFNLKLFFNKYEHLLREISIEKFVKNSPNKILHREIIKMLDNYNNSFTSYNQNNHKILIDTDFPKEILIKIMRPYLLLFYKSEYSLIPQIKYISSNELNNKLRKFKKFNPIFGRKLAVLGKTTTKNFKCKIHIKKYTFSDEHLSFNNINSDNFLLNHTIDALDADENSDFDDYYNNIVYNNNQLNDNIIVNDNMVDNDSMDNNDVNNNNNSMDDNASDSSNSAQDNITENYSSWNTVESEDES
jgi:hypothetical protein